uniref:Glycogen debranching enzyme n=1 Tax=Chromera velia CCMP2878 TaxID=1169474 RepID=A0A0G4I0H5_9ALVE|eukprot:Cvel_9931.t1-p1 / transcript=Cvel_9931.t1 / gene=Cvel_9931 / organism=Chromera_velia_CCMP2878 / gene_product=Glycogen debranching enzyme, putative / transcript_product=Glycogen debranching enzyme, putative / location=Cvel_scaffold587:10216-27613(+) / protein_length=1722 / sequence_SO=supercontig / SO=protein_coding / is_pseudo=false
MKFATTIAGDGTFERHGNEGVFRICVGHTLKIFLPSGVTVNDRPILKLVDGVGDETELKGCSDTLGNITYEWAPAVGGPHKLTFEHAGENGIRTTAKANHVIVQPQFVVGSKEIPYTAITMQTVLSRCLGPISNWNRMVEPLNYNVLHFVPIQTPGESGSCYSLANQREIAPVFFSEEERKVLTGEPQKRAVLKKAVEDLDKRCVASTIDLVLNHTANDSPWLTQHPESGYDVATNSPHLLAARELDNEIRKFSLAVVDAKFQHSHGVTKDVDTWEALEKLMACFTSECLKPFRIGEWLTIDKAACKENLKKGKSMGGSPMKIPEGKDKRAFLMDEVLKTVGVKRNGACASPEALAAACGDEREMGALIDSIQQELWGMAGKQESEIPEKIKGWVRYERLELKKGPLGKKRWEGLHPNYFTEVEDAKGEKHYLANNGWVVGWDASKDFAAPGSLVYLFRDLVCWSDCVKLRFGERPEDAPFLWQHMKMYCVEAAEVFHGVRLDNCHSTPLHVAKYMLTEARRVRPQLWVYAELFTGDMKVDWMFEEQLGLNSLIREAMNAHNGSNLAYEVEKYSGKPMGMLCGSEPQLRSAGTGEAEDVEIFLPSGAGTPLFFDCTHDNPTPAEKRTPQDALPTAAAAAASLCALGSTRGFDELVPHNLSVVLEQRLHKRYYPSEEDEKDQAAASSASQADGSTGKTKTEAAVDPQPPSASVEWPYAGPSRVEVCGSWDGWKARIPLSRASGGGSFSATLTEGKELPQGQTQFQFKFILDGSQWVCDGQRAKQRDASGNENNLLDLSLPNGVSAEAPTSDGALPGIYAAKAILNKLHVELPLRGFTELSTSAPADDFVVMKRLSKTEGRLCVFVLRTAFHQGGSPHGLPEVPVEGKVVATHLCATLVVHGDAVKKFREDPQEINGLASKLQMHKDMGPMARADYSGSQNMTYLKVHNMPCGSVLVFETELSPGSASKGLDKEIETLLGDLPGALQGADLVACSYLLYSCENEEKNRSKGTRGLYDIMGYGPLKYAGIAGVIPVLAKARLKTPEPWQEPPPVVANIKAGDWLIGYLTDRLDWNPALKGVKDWMHRAKDFISKAPTSLKAYVFDRLVGGAYATTRRYCLGKMPAFIKDNKDEFVKDLAIATLQFYSYTPSAPLIWETDHPSLCAGLPHFSTDFMRNWGRDTFISLPGVLLVTGRFKEAREEILGFARVCRHGLIPNLLDAGNNPRYNARDATWFFMQAIQDYCCESDEGAKFLSEKVNLKYPPEEGFQKPETVLDLMLYILKMHGKGISFREWNAGKQIDEHMTDDGFNVNVWVDRETGICFGGNRHNCGTWMDKMGSSAKARNKGVPATPRDGADVEINGCLKSTLRWLSKLANKPQPGLPSADVDRLRTETFFDGKVTLSAWSSLMEASFEKLFFVPLDPKNDSKYVIDPKLVRIRGILKDTYKATKAECDYQLRCNAPVAMAVAPELFSSAAALAHIKNACERLFEPASLGPKTLAPGDHEYRPNYDNGNDGEDGTVAHGFNYHNGPEWVWPIGYFLCSILAFHEPDEKPEQWEKRRSQCMRLLLCHRRHIREDPWLSLPEITNENGQFCFFGCPAQAWSVATPLVFLQALDAVAAAKGQEKEAAAVQEPKTAPVAAAPSDPGQGPKANGPTKPAPAAAAAQMQPSSAAATTPTSNGPLKGAAAAAKAKQEPAPQRAGSKLNESQQSAGSAKASTSRPTRK